VVFRRHVFNISNGWYGGVIVGVRVCKSKAGYACV